MSELIIPVKVGLAGRFSLAKYRQKKSGLLVPLEIDAAPTGNLITNWGLDTFGSSSTSSVNEWIHTCQVGSGNATPDPDDVQLANFVAETPTIQTSMAISGRNIGDPPWYIDTEQTWRFGEGVAEGNLSEIGLRRNSGMPRNLFCRALIEDQNGNPTSITVLGDEILDATYRLRYIIPHEDVTGTTMIDGSPHDWTLRACGANSGPPGANGAPGWPGAELSNRRQLVPIGVAPSNQNAQTSAVNTIGLQSPTITPSLATLTGRAASSVDHPAYTPGNHYRDIVYTWNLDRGNSAGINVVFLTTVLGGFQIGFDPSFEKLATQRLRVTLRVFWERA